MKSFNKILLIGVFLTGICSTTFGTELYYSNMSTVSDWIEASNAGNEDGDSTGGIRVVNGDKVQMNSWWDGAEWTEIFKDLGYTIQADKMYTMTVNMQSYAASAAVDLKLQNVTESSDIAINVVNPQTSGFNNYSVAFSTAQGQNSDALGDTLGISIYGGWWNNLAVTDVTVEEVDDTGGLSESYTIDLTTRYQEVTGFGAGTIFYANHLIDGLPPQYQENTYQKLFGDLNHTYHMFWFRAEVESSNDNSDPYVVDLGGFSFGANQDRFVTILNESLTRNPDVIIAVTIMSPPAWLKTNGSVNGGGTLDTSVNNAYEEFGEFAFANLLWFKQQGISIDILNLMNEPDEVLSGQEDASYTATQSRDVHKYTVDHIRYLVNSSENTAGVVMPLIMMPSTCDAAKANSFINECKSDGAAWDNVDVVAVHHYYETSTAGYQAIYDNIEGKPLIMSEWHSAWGGDIGPGMTEIMEQSTAIITSMKGGVASFWWFETNHPVDSVTGLCWQPWWAETVFGQTYDSWRQWADLTPVGGDRVQVNKGGGGMGLTDIAFDKSSTGQVTLVVLNEGADQYIDVSVTGESMSHIDYYHTTETESYTLVSSVTPDPSEETFLVEAESLNMFVITYGPGDTTPPAAPTNLIATAGVAQVSLDWDDNAESDLDSYNVYRDTTSGGPYTRIATDVATSDYTDNSVSGGTTYYYVVTAEDTASNESGYSNEDSATPSAPAQTPYTSHQIPGTIEAEDYDYGGEGVAYHDDTGGNAGGSYRSDDVDIQSCSEGGYNVGWISGAEWLEYTVDNISAGTYDIELRVASNTSGGTLHIEFDGQDVTGTINFGATGGWQNWTSVYVNDVSLSAGQQVMRIAMDSSGFNLNWVKFEAVDTTPPAAPAGLTATAGDAQVSLDWADNTEPDLAGYNVYRSTTSGSGYSQLNGSLVGSSDYTDNSASNGTTYYYVVTAVDTSSNESGYSNEASATPTAGGSAVVFSDSFENGEWNGLWNEDSQNDWKDSAQRAVDGSYSAEVDGSASDATLTSILIDLQGKTNATVTFSWLIEKGLDSGEYLAFDVSTNGGSNWVEKAILRGNVDPENTWHNPGIDVTGISGGFQIRFRAKMSRSNEDANVDMVEVLAW